MKRETSRGYRIGRTRGVFWGSVKEGSLRKRRAYRNDRQGDTPRSNHQLEKEESAVGNAPVTRFREVKSHPQKVLLAAVE